MEGTAAARKRSWPETANGAVAGGKRSKGEASLYHQSHVPFASIFWFYQMSIALAPCEKCFGNWICVCPARVEREGVLVGRLIMLVICVPCA
jgi:hypothetical protein